MADTTTRQIGFAPVAVPGWRITFIDVDNDKQSYSVKPLAGWCTVEYIEDGKAILTGTLAAYCTETGHVFEVEEEDDYAWKVLGPGEPDPTEDQIIDELVRRRRIVEAKRGGPNAS